ncbi:SDR family NAD(P)-dependent oxidoreductase [Paraburkholderia acidisoli]|uniref:SDR family NAD(P)-dependent oxidoreductase n=1 Tax=Paraburkholderia acidisoli TaxID=2571748 RepID=A0A7Z2GN83_9BURK|nr:SDR family NAD(P)-dependent oxidoreductase [Paraburkholderia acidisoli]QGZ64691.1 SDR family NAD(P)-dependent oxidoreductase [Paraburkholderia acidisoli]
MTRQTVLVLGATGGIGGEVARQMLDAGWTVRGMRRASHAANTANAANAANARRDGIEWIQGDAMRREDVLRAARGAAVIVHAVNPPGYRNWADLVVPMIDNTIAAAQAEGATIVLPGTVYNFGPDAFPLLEEDSPQHPVTKKGAIRVELESRLQRASETGTQAVIVRAGDFFGPNAGNSWFSQGFVKPGQPVRKISNPSARGAGHQWAYLPDVARTMVELVARRDTLGAFARFHMGGHWDEDGRQLAAAIQRAVERRAGRTPAIAAFPWWVLPLAAPFNTTLRELGEMRYLWRTPVRMSNARLVDTLGREPHTPLDEAVETTLAGLGCLPAARV